MQADDSRAAIQLNKTCLRAACATATAARSSSSSSSSSSSVGSVGKARPGRAPSRQRRTVLRRMRNREGAPRAACAVGPLPFSLTRGARAVDWGPTMTCLRRPRQRARSHRGHSTTYAGRAMDGVAANRDRVAGRSHGGPTSHAADGLGGFFARLGPAARFARRTRAWGPRWTLVSRQAASPPEPRAARGSCQRPATVRRVARPRQRARARTEVAFPFYPHLPRPPLRSCARTVPATPRSSTTCGFETRTDALWIATADEQWLKTWSKRPLPYTC